MRITICLCFILISTVTFSQFDLYLNLSSTERNAEVVFKDGRTEKGKIFGFITPRFIKLDMNLGFKTVEKNLNLTDKAFTLENEDGERRKINADEVAEVREFVGNYIIEYKRLNLKTVNSKREIIDLEKQVWLSYFVNDDRINIMGFSAVDNGGRYAGTYVYLNREEEDFAINPVDFNRLNFFNLGKMDDKMEVALLETFRDCPSTVSSIKAFFALSNRQQKKFLKNNVEDLIAKGILKDKKKLSMTERFENSSLWVFKMFLYDYNENCPVE